MDFIIGFSFSLKNVKVMSTITVSVKALDSAMEKVASSRPYLNGKAVSNLSARFSLDLVRNWN